MSETITIRCHGCGARIVFREAYAVYDEHACSAECVRTILLRDFKLDSLVKSMKDDRIVR